MFMGVRMNNGIGGDGFKSVDLPGGGRGIGEDGIGAVDLLIKGDQKWNWW